MNGVMAFAYSSEMIGSAQQRQFQICPGWKRMYFPFSSTSGGSSHAQTLPSIARWPARTSLSPLVRQM